MKKLLKSTFTYLLLCLIVINSCSGKKGTESSSATTTLRLNLKNITLPHTWQPFDNPLGKTNSELPPQTLNLQGLTTLYGGELKTHDSFETTVFVGLFPSASINRVLLQVNGGTATDPRESFKNHNHKIAVIISMRGLHYNDIRSQECTLNTQLSTCLNNVSYLQKVNPLDNGKDIVNLMKIILGTAGSVYVDNTKRTDLFNITGGDNKINIETGSFGATLLGYALAQPDLPTTSIGRIFIEGPSSPSENVITDGFRNNQVYTDNLLTAIGMDSTEKTNFINVLKARHTSFNTTCDPSLQTNPTADCLSTAAIYKYMIDEYEDITQYPDGDSSIANDLATLKANLIAISTTDSSSDATGLAAVVEVYTNSESRSITSWDDSKRDFTQVNRKEEGFTSRVALICSSYINRQNGDSLAAFNTAKADSNNDPYWYGFLIAFRDFLNLCPQIENNLTANIAIPNISNINLNIEALVQYGAGIDEKHHQSEITEMQGYIDNTTSVIKSFYQRNATQGGSSIDNENCREDLERVTFEGNLNNLASGIDSVIAASCSNP